METNRAAWALVGVLAGAAGLAAGHLVAGVGGSTDSPVVAVAEQVIRHTPGGATEQAIDALGHADKPVLVVGILLVVALTSAGLGILAARHRGLAVGGFTLLSAIGLVAVLAQPGESLVPLGAVLVGYLVSLAVLLLLAASLERLAPDMGSAPTGVSALEMSGASTRRGFLIRVGVVAGLTAVTAYGGELAARGRRAVEAARDRLRLPGVTPPRPDAAASTGVAGQPRWQTSNGDFYRIDTAIVPPAVLPQEWRLRIHGLVERELELTFDDLLGRPRAEAWVTLACVSNQVGGDLVGNAWWSGVRVAPLLAEAGVRPEADGVLQTAHDGWTCLTPLEVLTDDRDALLAVAMNGRPLPIAHGFPVRMVVPGLYGYVSATKWVVDLEVTRFDQAQGYWTDKGWDALGPIKLASRIDVPGQGQEVSAGEVVLAGVAWQQHTGIAAVEVSIDDDEWERATLAAEPTVDAWVQWRHTVRLRGGDHTARVRAINRAGEVQTEKRADPAPNGASGWHRVDFSVR